MAYLFAVIGSAGLLSAAGPVGDAADVLEHSAVYVNAGTYELIDVSRARDIVGDRPIVVAAMTERAAVVCDDVAAAVPEVVVLVVSTDGSAMTCGDSPYHNPSLRRRAQDAVAFLEPEGTELVAAYVRLFDAHVAAAFPGQAPPRRPAPWTPSAFDRNVPFGVLAVIFGGLALFGARVVRRLWRDAQWVKAKARRWRAETNARLDRLADLVLRPGEPANQADAEHRADIAGRYVLALRRFEESGRPEQAGELAGMIAELEADVGLQPAR